MKGGPHPTRLTAGHKGPTGPASLKSVHWTDFRALGVPTGGRLLGKPAIPVPSVFLLRICKHLVKSEFT